MQHPLDSSRSQGQLCSKLNFALDTRSTPQAHARSRAANRKLHFDFAVNELEQSGPGTCLSVSLLFFEELPIRPTTMGHGGHKLRRLSVYQGECCRLSFAQFPPSQFNAADREMGHRATRICIFFQKYNVILPH